MWGPEVPISMNLSNEIIFKIYIAMKYIVGHMQTYQYFLSDLLSE